MIKHVSHISVRSVLPISAALFFILGSFSAISAAIAAALAPGQITSFVLSGPVNLSFTRVPPAWVFLLYPLLSAVAGAIGSAVLVWLYNVIAPRAGAIQITLTD